MLLHGAWEEIPWDHCSYSHHGCSSSNPFLPTVWEAATTNIASEAEINPNASFSAGLEGQVTYWTAFLCWKLLCEQTWHVAFRQ